MAANCCSASKADFQDTTTILPLGGAMPNGDLKRLEKRMQRRIRL